ncbi:MAG: hypothetical protein R3B96_09870 [Pirellulaceae bacterium]
MKTRLAASGHVLVDHSTAAGSVKAAGSLAKLGFGLLDIAFLAAAFSTFLIEVRMTLFGAVTLTANLVLSQSLLSTLRIGHGSD